MRREAECRLAVGVGVAAATAAAARVVVTAGGYGATRATVQVWRRRADGWHRAMGPWSAWVGYNGFAPRGAKREGDGRTPSGSYRFSFAFGAHGNPGTRYHWRRTRST